VKKGTHLLHNRGYLNDIGKLEFCEHCVFGKQKRVSFSLSTHCTKDILDYIHSDLWVGLLILLLEVVII
jgi:hypothetical protein